MENLMAMTAEPAVKREKISLAGDLGSGKSTVSAILVERLGAVYYSTGAIVRRIANERGISVGELNRYMETDPEIDHEIDAGVAALGDEPGRMIIDSRMAWHFTKGTFKVYLSTDVETSAARIMNAGRAEEQASSLKETIENTRARVESEKKRYFEQYGVHIKDLSNYDLIVDTTYATPSEVADAICEGFDAWQQDSEYKCVLVSPERLNYIDEAADSELISSLSSVLDEGGEIPEVTVYERDGEFYVEEGLESALAYGFAMRTFVKCRLVAGNPDGRKYVKMQNTL